MNSQIQLYVEHEVLENGTNMVCDHSEVEIVFVSIIESEI